MHFVKCYIAGAKTRRGDEIVKVTRLEELRAKAFLTQESLAERSGVSRDTISKLETGERVNAHARTIAKLAKALNVEPWELRTHLPPSEEPSVGSPEGKGTGGVSLGRLLGDRRKNRKVQLEVNESQLDAAMHAYWHTLEELLPEETPPEAFVNLMWVAHLVQGRGYEEARAEAERLVYGSDGDL